jgi:hypothetical protein
VNLSRLKRIASHANGAERDGRLGSIVQLNSVDDEKHTIAFLSFEPLFAGSTSVGGNRIENSKIRADKPFGRVSV